MRLFPSLHDLPILLLTVLLIRVDPATTQELPDTFHLGEVVVTAHRIELPLSRIPQAVTILDGPELRSRGLHFVQDALREVPGMQVVRTGSIGASTSLFLRGGNSDFVKVLLDGVPLNEPGGRFDFGALTLENVERIEVVRGPASVLYGSDAVAGVVQIFTRRGEGSPRLSGGVQGGSLGSWMGDAGARGAWDRLSYSVSLGRTETDGSYPVNNRFTSLVGSGRVEVSPDPASQLAFTLRIAESRYHFPTGSDGEVQDSNQFNFDESVAVSFEAGRRLSPAWEGRLLLRTHRAERGFEDEPDTPADTLGFGFRSRRLGTVLRRGADARLVRRGERSSFTGGVDWEVERERLVSRTESNFGGGLDVSAGSFQGDRWNGGAYGEWMIDGPIGTAWSVGARLDRNEVFGSFLTGRAGLVMPAGDHHRFRISTGSAYKAPTFSEQFAASPFEVGNPDLTPEESRSWEVGWDGGVAGNRLTASAAWFHQDFRNLIEYAFLGPDAPSYYNRARAEARGVETGLRLEARRGVWLAADYTYLDARSLDPEDAVQPGDLRLLRRPTHLLAGKLRAPFPGDGQIGLAVTRVGNRADMDYREFPARRVTLESYTTTDLDVQLPLSLPGSRSEQLQVSFRLENLLDQEFETVVGFPGMGRLFRVGIRWNP